MAGNLIARAIVEGDQTWREFSPFELVWGRRHCRPRRRAACATGSGAYRDRIEQRRARARELAHIQRARPKRCARPQRRRSRLAWRRRQRSRHDRLPRRRSRKDCCGRCVEEKAAAEQAARVAALAEAEEAARVAAAAELKTPVAKGPLPNELEQSAADQMPRASDDLMTPSEVTPEPIGAANRGT